MATEKRFGRQTPTQSFVLDYDRSLYSEAVRLYESSGNSMYDWQKKLLRDIMAIDGEQLWTHSKVGYSVPRRNGKTEVVYAREIYGLMKGEQICHTAHRTSTSHSSFEKTKKLLEKAGIEFESKQARGAEVIEIPETGERFSTGHVPDRAGWVKDLTFWSLTRLRNIRTTSALHWCTP